MRRFIRRRVGRAKKVLSRNEDELMVLALLCGAVSIIAALVSAAWTVFGW